MITKRNQSKKKSFKGVKFEILAVGNESMVTKMNYELGNSVPLHSHPNEQSGYVISGKHRLIFLDFDQILTEGDSYSIPKNVNHSWEVIIEGEVIDVFTPPRKDYI